MLTRFGGVAGISRTMADVDATRLSPETRVHLADLLARSNFWSLPADLPSTEAHPDQFGYELTVEDDGRKHAVSFDEASQGAELRALIEAVRAVTRGA